MCIEDWVEFWMVTSVVVCCSTWERLVGEASACETVEVVGALYAATHWHPEGKEYSCCVATDEATVEAMVCI